MTDLVYLNRRDRSPRQRRQQKHAQSRCPGLCKSTLKGLMRNFAYLARASASERSWSDSGRTN